MRRGISSCERHRRVDAAPSPWKMSWGGCAPWAALGEPRQRAVHAIAQMQLLPPGTRPAVLRDHQADTDAAECCRMLPKSRTPSAHYPGTTPARQVLCLASGILGLAARKRKNSWLFIPLLHAGAANLTARAQHDWRSCPGAAANATPAGIPDVMAGLGHGGLGRRAFFFF